MIKISIEREIKLNEINICQMIEVDQDGNDPLAEQNSRTIYTLNDNWYKWT